MTVHLRRVGRKMMDDMNGGPPPPHGKITDQVLPVSFFIDNLLVRIHFIIVMIRRTGLAPWVFESPVLYSLTSTFLFSTTHRAAEIFGGFERPRIRCLVRRNPPVSLRHRLPYGPTGSCLHLREPINRYVSVNVNYLIEWMILAMVQHLCGHLSCH